MKVWSSKYKYSFEKHRNVWRTCKRSNLEQRGDIEIVDAIVEGTIPKNWIMDAGLDPRNMESNFQAPIEELEFFP